jgi:hypothetical protein
VNFAKLKFVEKQYYLQKLYGAAHTLMTDLSPLAERVQKAASDLQFVAAFDESIFNAKQIREVLDLVVKGDYSRVTNAQYQQIAAAVFELLPLK